MNARSEELMLAHRGFVFSQALTLYTTPVVYLYFDRLRIWWASSVKERWLRCSPRSVCRMRRRALRLFRAAQFIVGKRNLASIGGSPR
jgi:hypothetical protein